MNLAFSKMQGLGNDFVVIDNLDGSVNLDTGHIIKLCDRRFGIGADGLILVEKRGESDCYMNHFNAEDGLPVEMCGNGIRCVAHFYRSIVNIDANSINVGSNSGVKNIELVGENSYKVNMGSPIFKTEDLPGESLELQGCKLDFVSMGNPHAVTIVDDVKDIELAKIGPKIEMDSHFPNRVNFEIVQKIDDAHVRLRVWERGVGITMACGTGCCAAYTVMRNLKLVSENVEFELDGGKLNISENDIGEILMTGPAEIVYSGNINI